jgi:hypothetical protein
MTLHELFTTDTTVHWRGLRLENRYGSDPFAAVRQGHDKWRQLSPVEPFERLWLSHRRLAGRRAFLTDHCGF